MTSKKVTIVHVPYEHRGGEDIHVELLAKSYEAIGMEVSFFPKNRVFNFEKKLLAQSISSLLPTDSKNWDEYFKDSDFLHLHNIFPTLGPRFLKWCIERKKKVWMTVHNHRFFCTNGLALRDEKICTECFSDFSFFRPLKYNCNQNLKKTLYHTLARKELHDGNLYDQAIEKFIAPSPYIAGVLKKLGIDSKKITVLQNPVLKIEKTKSSEYTGEVDVLFAGRLSTEKGIDTLLKTVPLLKELTFVICGDGPLRKEVETAVSQNPNLIYLGTKSPDQVADLIKRCKLTVLPSICNEILPTFVLESYIWCKSCVLSKLESTAWLGKPEFPGFFADPGNPKSFEVAITKALSNQSTNIDPDFYLKRLGFERFCTELKALVFRNT